MKETTQSILDHFDRISAIPRCSGNEAAVAKWIGQWAEKKGFGYRTDEAGNRVVRVPASEGMAEAPSVVIQGHMDMVCEKTPDSPHNFSSDPIRPVRDGDWLRAEGTTLGADNGIALALALALADASDVAHPPLELLFTVDEESGLNGAKKLQPGFIESRMLLNVDSETEGVFTVGCAGGRDTRIVLPLDFDAVPENFRPCRIIVGGLSGGHSGIDIHRQRGNANVLLARMLHALLPVIEYRLAEFHGGSAHNAIARDAVAVLWCDPSRIQELGQRVGDFEATVRIEFAAIEPSLSVSLEKKTRGKSKDAVLSPACCERVIRTLLVLPHGVARFSSEIPGLVETSNNLATVAMCEDELHILTSQRSSLMSRMDEMTGKIISVAALAGSGTETDNEFPPWPANMASPLLQRCSTVYRKLFRQEPKVELIHAGLECAIIGDRYPDMDMISFGPDIENPHSPDERLNIPSIEKVWDFMVALLASFRSG
ncbi:MAG: aminoacyl-histidine dipeptidase [Desulfobacteraceae bacterium]|jgi:dipeptidase D|nr:aminoacyl-histidine dipeptidase [Desulfobacteraceae bacterium]